MDFSLKRNQTRRIDLDAGIIKPMKAKYRHDVIGDWLEELEKLLLDQAPGP